MGNKVKVKACINNYNYLEKTRLKKATFQANIQKLVLTIFLKSENRNFLKKQRLSIILECKSKV